MQKNDPFYTTQKNKFKMTKDLNVRPETTKTLEEDIGSKISDIAGSNILLNLSPQARGTKEKK